MLEMTDREFRELQAKILETDTSNNEYMPATTQQTTNKSLNTINKDVVSSINEMLETVESIRNDTHGGSGIINIPKITVNDEEPDPNGNIRIDMVLKAERDAKDNRIDKVYATKAEIKNLRQEFLDVKNNSANIVKSINGLSPDANGNFELKLVNRAAQADRADKDNQGRDIAGTYVTRSAFVKDLSDLSNSVIHTVNGKTPIKGDLDLKGSISEALNSYASKEDLKFYMRSVDVDEKLKAFDTVHTVNGIHPNRIGDVTIDMVKRADTAYSSHIAEIATQAEQDKYGNDIDKTYLKAADAEKEYASQLDLKQLQSEFLKQRVLDNRQSIKSINGAEPDINGDVKLTRVNTADRAVMDEFGSNISQYYATKQEVLDNIVFVKRTVSGIDNAYDLAVRNGLFHGTVEEWLAHLKGDQGIQGIQGPRGAQGPQGIQGPLGERAIIRTNHYAIIGEFAADRWKDNLYEFSNTNIKSTQIIYLGRLDETSDTDEMCGITCEKQEDGKITFRANNGIPADKSRFSLILQTIDNGDASDIKIESPAFRLLLSFNGWDKDGYYAIDCNEAKETSSIFVSLPTGADKSAHTIFSKADIGVVSCSAGKIKFRAFGEIPAQDLEIQVAVL